MLNSLLATNEDILISRPLQDVVSFINKLNNIDKGSTSEEKKEDADVKKEDALEDDGKEVVCYLYFVVIIMFLYLHLELF